MFMSARMLPKGQVTARHIGGRSHDNPVGPRPDPRALSCSIISFNPRIRGWLIEAINGLVGTEALEDTGDYIGNTQGRARDNTVLLRPDPRPLSRLVISFEPQTRG